MSGQRFPYRTGVCRCGGPVTYKRGPWHDQEEKWRHDTFVARPHHVVLKRYLNGQRAQPRRRAS